MRKKGERNQLSKSKPTSESEAGWAQFGWQGISAKVPSDWNLGAIGGSEKTGYLRLDDLEQPRLEVKWSSESSVDINKVLDNYLKSLTKKAKRSQPLTIDRNAKVVSKKAKPRKVLACFSWEGGARAFGVVWRCETCGRTVIAQVLSRSREDIAPLAREVLTSLEDHSLAGRKTWAVYGFSCQVPEQFKLEEHKLMAGYLEMCFLAGREKLKVARWGMANVALKQNSLPEWVESENQDRRDVTWQSRPGAAKGHEAVLLTGEQRRLAHRLRKGLTQLVRLRPAIAFSACFWHCPESNRIYGVENIHRGDKSLLQQIMDSIPCH